MNKFAVFAFALLALVAYSAHAGNSAGAAVKGDTSITAPPGCLPGQTLLPIYNAQGKIIGWKCAGNA